MRKGFTVSAGLALILAATAGVALARPRYNVSGGPATGYVMRHHGGPFHGLNGYIQGPRDFTDPGTKVLPGTTNRYMVEQTFFHRDPITKNQRSWYMGETLPTPLYNEWDPGLPVDWTP
ncbi:MAG: hypothetical protein N2444_01955 [Methylocystis sp.]|nr:hypothetical protein [Methylocystis sp.]